MKKILAVTAAVLSAIALTGCGSTGKTSAAPYTIHEGDGVIGYYTFDEEEIEDNEIIDHSGNELNIYSGALDGSILVEGKYGTALDFNGDDEYLSLEPETLDGDGVTIAAWVKPNSWRDWARVFDIGNTKEDAWCGMDFNTKMLRMDVFGAKGAVQILAPLPVAGNWTHIAAVFGKGTAALYINGKLAQKLPCGVTTADLAANVSGIYIGRSNWADPLFNGAMDELLVANRAFSDAEIASVFAGINIEASAEK